MLSESGQMKGWVLASSISGRCLPEGSNTVKYDPMPKSTVVTVHPLSIQSYLCTRASFIFMFNILLFFSLWSSCHISLYCQNCWFGVFFKNLPISDNYLSSREWQIAQFWYFLPIDLATSAKIFGSFCYRRPVRMDIQVCLYSWKQSERKLPCIVLVMLLSLFQ